MAKNFVVSVMDRAMEAYTRPVFVPAIGIAVRSFTDEINREGGEMYGHPGDYDLYLLSEFDEVTGLFVPLEGGIRRLARGDEVKVR